MCIRDSTSSNNLQLTKVTESISNKLKSMNGIMEVDDTRSLPGIEWIINVDRELAGKYGVDVSIIGSIIQLVTNGILVDKYLKKVAAADGSLPGIDKTIHDAFKLGRAAIVAKDYKLRDEQALIVKENLSKVIGRKAADYLRSGAKEITLSLIHI